MKTVPPFNENCVGPRGRYGPEGGNPHQNNQSPPDSSTLPKGSLSAIEIPSGRIEGKYQTNTNMSSEENKVVPQVSYGL